jgi:hypothetical protein
VFLCQGRCFLVLKPWMLVPYNSEHHPGRYWFLVSSIASNTIDGSAASYALLDKPSSGWNISWVLRRFAGYSIINSYYNQIRLIN